MEVETMSSKYRPTGYVKSNVTLKLVISFLLMFSLILFAIPFSKYFMISTHAQLTQTTFRTNLPKMIDVPEKIERLNVKDMFTHTTDKNTSAIGQIVIPNVKIIQPIFVGLTTKNMINGVVDLFPEREPERGTLTLIGHHVGEYNLLFARIDELKKGDVIYVQYFDHYYQYLVEENTVIDEKDIDQLANKGADYLFLVTCDQVQQTSRRVFIQARKVKGKSPNASQFSQTAATIKNVEGQQYITTFLLPFISLILIATFFLIYVWRT